MTDILFYSFGGMAVLSALFILFTRNVLHAAFSLVLVFLCVAALYIMANAEFVAVTQIMIYVGGIVVLIIFGVMLTHEITGKKAVSGSVNRVTGGIVATGLAATLYYGIIHMNLGVLSKAQSGEQIRNIGESLMTDFVLPFEVAAVLLLMALIGAAVVAADQLKKGRQ